MRWQDRSPEILGVIARLTEERGLPPTMRELGDALGLKSSSSVYKQLLKMRRAGLVVWDEKQVRTLRVVAA